MSKYSLSGNALLPKGVSFQPFPDAETLATTLAHNIADIISTAIALRGEALMAVSGGRTPAALFQALSQLPLEWEKVTITLVDERWVPNDHPYSNAKLVKEHLLQQYARAARFIPLYTGAATAEEGIDACNQTLAALPLPLDVALLGMGDDGHTASFFPYAAQLAHALNSDQLSCFVEPPEAPFDRATLTLSTLLQAAHLFIHISGAAKLPVLVEALSGHDSVIMPVRALLHQTQRPVDIFWSP